MKHPLLLLVFFTLLGFSGHAQRKKSAPPPPAFTFEDAIYQPYIQSVQLYVEGLALSYPMITLDASAPLVLEFDDLEGDVKDYFYRITYCDKDWQPAQISEMEYLDGFPEDRISNYQFSFKTVAPYTHYTLRLPNASMAWKLSGNYLLSVYEEGYQDTPVFTRRFVIADPRLQMSAQLVRPSAVQKMRTHQEIDFTLNTEKMPIRNPQQEIFAVVLQNGRWETAISDLSPLFVRGNQLVFDYQDKIVFPAGKEFRQLDIRSLRFRSPMVAAIENLRDRSEVILHKDQSRELQAYVEYNDINGKFITETQDQNNPLAANYAQVLFSFSAEEPFYDQDVYLIGQFNNWKQLPEYKMTYNPAVNSYVLNVQMKQGFYNYAYALAPRDMLPKSPNLSALEGDWFETENDYTILIYYRPFGGRYDQLIGLYHFNTRGQ